MHVFMTGFPGFIARRLVRRLLNDDPELRVTVLVESRMADAARDAAREIGGDRIALITGDITDRRLGLDDADYSRLTGDVDSVHHLAAIYDLSVPFELAVKVNVDGTGNVLDFCARCDHLERLHYASTAYVAGNRTGHVYEHELVMGQGFKNHYESTKFQAEVWVRERMRDIPTTIYRPAIVVGDSRSGETQKFDGPYYLLRVISRSARMKTPLAQFGRAGAPFNVVPVDFVIDALAVLSADPAAVGETLHLVDPEPQSAKQLMELLAHEYNGGAPRFSIPSSVAQESMRLKAVREMFSGAPRESIVYLNHEVHFDTRKAEELLNAHGLRCPRFPEYVGPMVGFFRAHEDDQQLRPMQPA